MLTTDIDEEVLNTMQLIPEKGGTCHPHGRVIKVFYGWSMLGEIEYGGEDADIANIPLPHRKNTSSAPHFLKKVRGTSLKGGVFKNSNFKDMSWRGKIIICFPAPSIIKDWSLELENLEEKALYQKYCFGTD